MEVELFIRKVKGIDNGSCASFSILPGILSNPVAFFALDFFKYIITVSVSIWRKEKEFLSSSYFELIFRILV